ncbi:MAG: hypothetical protein KGQ93_12120 [Cyanobacteria bacterium REEB459]|nr:hypothetical protein [Cyanobacteria bacterium REEB459]
MKQRQQIFLAGVGLVLAAIVCGVALSLRQARLNAATIGQARSSTWLAAALTPLKSLRLMQRQIATSGAAEAGKVPVLSLLKAPITTTGLGPIHLGMSRSEVEALGFKLLPIQGNGKGECQYYRVQDQSEPIGFMAIQNRILRIDIWPGSLAKTRSGVKIGSTEADLIRYYGKDQLEAISNPVTLGKTITFTPTNQAEDLYRIVFEVDDRGQVVQYRVGQFPAVSWPEGCF